MSDIIIKVLGTAQDGGYPQPGCDCPNCIRVRKNRNLIRYPASLAVLNKKEKSTYLIDPTPQLPAQLEELNQMAKKLNFPDDHLKEIIITHAHIGHYTGLMYFGKEAINSSGLKVRGSSRLKEFLTTNQPWQSLVENNNIIINIFIFGQDIYSDKNFNIEPIKVPHRAEFTDTAGFLIKGQNKSLFYLPDIDSWEGFRPKFADLSSKTDYMVIDGTFYTKEELGELRGRNIDNVPHPPIEDTINELLENKLEKNESEVYFTHFNHTNKVLDPNFTNDFKEDNIFFLSEDMNFEL